MRLCTRKQVSNSPFLPFIDQPHYFTLGLRPLLCDIDTTKRIVVSASLWLTRGSFEMDLGNWGLASASCSLFGGKSIGAETDTPSDP